MQQQEAISKFVEERVVFVAFPTDYGMSLCYTCLPTKV